MLLIPLLSYRLKRRQAQPTKLPPTRFTSHMITTLILLNTSSTPLPRTFLCRLPDRALAGSLLGDVLRRALAQRHADIVLLAGLASMPLALVVDAVGKVAGGAAEDWVFGGRAGVDLARGAARGATPAEVR